MREIETDYLVVGAGASGMAFVDELIAQSDADVVMVDKRHRPGGHWNDAYPFVRLHQPSANYGVSSRVLGNDRIDETGPNAGFYERATPAEILDYYDHVLERHLIPSGRVRFFGMSEYKGGNGNGHTIASTLSGQTTTVKVRRKVVDATYTESWVPSRHTPSFQVDADVLLIPPNDLVNLAEPAAGYTVIGAGKTAMDTCNWLLDEGVEPNRIRWIRPTDSWAVDRTWMQPLELVGSIMEFQSRFVEAAAQASSGADFFRQLEPYGMMRIDPDVEPGFWRGATLSATELQSLRHIDNVVRKGKVRRLSTQCITLDDGEIPTDPRDVHIDCTAAGARSGPVRPVFEQSRVIMQFVTLGIVPWSAATLAFLEATRPDDEEKNRLCPAVQFTGLVSEWPQAALAGLRGLTARLADPEVSTWNDSTRLNLARGAADHMSDPGVQASFTRMIQNIEPALENLGRLVASSR